MKKCILFVCTLAIFVSLLLSGCSVNDLLNFLYIQTDQQYEMKAVEKVGVVPDAFKSIIENNTFHDIVAFENCILKAEICSVDEENNTVEYRVQMLDLYGTELASYSCTSDDAYHVSALTGTSDGGFLFVLGFQDYARDEGWASNNGFASRVIKCDSNGNVQFDTALADITERGLLYCFEKNGQFYFFGEVETLETKTQGVSSATDIYMVILEKNGSVLKNARIAGSDFDCVDMAEQFEDGFLLSISSQSDDGAFAGSNSGGYGVDWVITVDDSLEIIEKKKATGRDHFDYQIGIKDGTPVHGSDSMLDGFDAGSPKALIDYGEFYMVVSENKTGIYENTPSFVSSIWYYTETVYSAYDDSGKLVFRDAVNSSPDYDAICEELT